MKLIGLALSLLLTISQASAADHNSAVVNPSAIATIKAAQFKKITQNFSALSKFDADLSDFLKSYEVSAFVRGVEQKDVVTVSEETGVTLNGHGRILTVLTSMDGIMRLLAHPKVTSVSLSSVLEPKPAVTGSNH